MMQLVFSSRQQDMRPAFLTKSMKLPLEVYRLSQHHYSRHSSAGRMATHFWWPTIQTHLRGSASSCTEIAPSGKSCVMRASGGSEQSARLTFSKQISRIV